MRKLITALLGALVLLCPTAHAVEMNLIYDEIYHYYYAEDVFVEINGRPVATREMPPVVLMDRTLVPAREVFEALGATVTWLGETGQTKINYGGTEVLFTTGSRTVYLGRSRVTIPDSDPAPMIINDKTMVPVRIVANLLGFDVEWDNARRTVMLNDPSGSSAALGGVSSSSSTASSSAAQPPAKTPSSVISAVSCKQNGNTDLIYLTFSDPVEPEIARYTNPNRVVLDFNDTVFTANPSVSFSGLFVTSVRGAAHDSMARVVLDVSRQPNIDVQRSQDGIVIIASPAGSRYSTSVGDLTGGSVYVPPTVTPSISGTGETPTVTQSGEGVELDLTGTVDTTDTRDFDYNAVVIDAGHGGSDPGAMSGSIKESAINLAIAQKVTDKLRAAGYTVVTTRDDDNTYPTLQDRVDIASKKTASGKIPAIFVSVHCNSFERPETNGTQVYYHPDSKYGTILAQNIYNANVALTELKPAQIHDGSNLYVIRKTLQPAALVETAFISNSSDRSYLTGEEGQEALAEGIFTGIVQTMERMRQDNET